jgi:hypothetical protein
MKKVRSEVDKEKPRMLEIEPFQKWLEKQIDPERYNSVDNLSKIISINSKKLCGYKAGVSYSGKIITHISIDDVDKAAVLTGHHISDIYEDYFDWR